MIISGQHASHSAQAGGKALALLRLIERNFPVPGFIVLTPGEKVDVEELAMQLAAMGGGRFAVRSSGVDEDGMGHSFAGQFETYLDVNPGEIIGRIDEVRASGRSDRLTAYREGRGLDEGVGEPAVIVQRMVDAEVAGVAFSADPVSGRRGVVVVSAVPGLGDALVSGATDADAWEIDRSGVVEMTHKVSDRKERCLSDEQVVAVAELARRCEASFGLPQDIEWAIDGTGKLYLLQSRPITTLRELPDPDDALRVWDNSNIAESYSGVTTPLTFSFARRAYEEVYRQFCRLMGVEQKRMQRHDEVFAQMLGILQGRVYYNLLSWYRVLALLPGFALNRRFMEQMMGVREPLPDPLTESVVRMVRVSRWRDAMALVRTVFGLIFNAVSLRRNVKRFYQRLDCALAPCAVPLEQQSLDELVSHYRELEQQLLKRWDAPLVNDFFAMICYGVLRSLCRKWAGDEDGTLQNTLLMDIDGIISAEPPRLIRKMADMVSPFMAALLTDDDVPVSRKLEAIRGEAELAGVFEKYLQKFGDRCLHELKLESPTLEEDPEILLNSIGLMSLRGGVDRGEVEDQGAEEVALPGGMRGVIFRWVLRLTRARVRDRENLRFERTRVFGWVRRIFRQVGRRLVADGILADDGEVFYLEVEEILRLVEGASAIGDAGGIARLRMEIYAGYQSAPAPPDRVTTHGPLHRYAKFDAAGNDEEVVLGDRVQGVGASPGVVRGKVRVVRDPRDATLKEGEILVAEQTDPGWVVLFAGASGLLVERGSMLSHSAIVSREMNLPCVVSLRGIMSWLRTGDLVEMDGRRGTVRLLKGND